MNRIYRFCLCSAVLTLMVLGAVLPAGAAGSNSRLGTTGTDPAAVKAMPFPPQPPLPPFDPRTKFVETWTCDLFGPAEVQGYRVVCPNGTFLDFFTSDGFIPGDHWELKGKNWDLFPTQR